jgi:aspartyl-tRNA(Asn)/glutamyl-tRNA(Gln) amidotransferase subunit A
MDATDLCFVSAVDLVEAVRTKAVSPLEVTRAVLDRIEQHNAQINAFCTPTPELALEQARQLESALMRGESLGPLGGVPISVKDLTAVKGVRTAKGSLLYADYVSDEDSPAVERVKQAGAIVIGKTNTPEFGWKGDSGNRVFGPTANPWDQSKTAGGSSGGAAAAVVTGMGPLALGTDGAGSIRIPASFCGAVGLKAQLWRVPIYPNSANEALGHLGPITRTVRDSALLLDVIAGPDERDRLSLPAYQGSFLRACEGDLRGLRVAWSRDLGYAAVDPEVAAICEAAAQRFASDLGCELEEAHPGFSDPIESELLLFYAGVGANLHNLSPEQLALLDPEMLRACQEETHGKSAIDWALAQMVRQELSLACQHFFQRYDLLLTPSIAVLPFGNGEEGPRELEGRALRRFGWTPFTYPFNLTGQPALTIPAGWSESGLPVGLQIVGRRYDEASVLRAGAAFEQIQPWQQRYRELT